MKEDPEKRVNMRVDIENECYICPECGEIIKWGNEGDENK